MYFGRGRGRGIQYITETLSYISVTNAESLAVQSAVSEKESNKSNGNVSGGAW